MAGFRGKCRIVRSIGMIVWSVALASVLVSAETSLNQEDLKQEDSNSFRNGADGSDLSYLLKVANMLWESSQSGYQHVWLINSPAAFYAIAGGIAAGFMSLIWSFGYICVHVKLQRSSINPEEVDETDTTFGDSGFFIQQWKYDVFLSFRGPDTRNNFTGHLYNALMQAGIKTFLDEEELHGGKQIKQELLKTVQQSKMCIIVFSKNYASSRWCLDELVVILHCMRTMGQLVLPIFYDVDPSIVRHQTKSYAKAFQHFAANHWDKPSVKKWRAALKEAADLSGHRLKEEENGNEYKFIQKIVAKVLPQVKSKCLILPDNLVGIGSRLNSVNQLLNISDHGVRTVGIYGMAGIGKTTVSKAVFNHHMHQFEGCAFVADIRNRSKLPDGLVRLQEKLLSQLLNRKVEVDSIDDGIKLINEICNSKRVLILLDDLDKLIQVRSLAGHRKWFKSGSRIIMNSRDLHLLKQAYVDEKYEVTELDDDESLKLFCWHAFGKTTVPSEDYRSLSNGMVKYAGGIPLALQEIGSYLIEKSVIEWQSALEKIQQIPLGEIQEELEGSFNALSDDKVKDIFLDIACFFIGMKKDFAIAIWDACGFFPEDGISTLTNKNLLQVDRKNSLRMHSLVCAVGREIIRKQSIKWPANRSRLWRHDEVLDVLTNIKGTNVIEGVCLNFSGLQPIHLESKTFKGMPSMRLLRINNVQLTGSFEHLFEELRWLSWRYCDLPFLPVDLNLKNIVMLDLSHSKIMIVWPVFKQLKHLKILDLSFCEFLSETPNFTEAQNVEMLILKGCRRLAKLHPSILYLINLRFFDFGQCGNFTTCMLSLLLNALGSSLSPSYLTYPLLLPENGLRNADNIMTPEDSSSNTESENRMVMSRKRGTGLVSALRKILNIFPFASFRGSIVS